MHLLGSLSELGNARLAPEWPAAAAGDRGCSQAIYPMALQFWVNAFENSVSAPITQTKQKKWRLGEPAREDILYV